MEEPLLMKIVNDALIEQTIQDACVSAAPLERGTTAREHLSLSKDEENMPVVL